MPKAVIVIFGVFIVIAVCIVVVSLFRQPEASSAVPLDRLCVYMRQRPDNRYFVRYTSDGEERWESVKEAKDKGFVAQDGRLLDDKAIKNFVAAYKSGEVFDFPGGDAPLPPELHSIEMGVVDKNRLIELDEEVLKNGEQFVKVVYGTCEARPEDPTYYSTTIENISSHKVRVTKFAGFGGTGFSYRLSTITGDYFTAENFVDWYGVADNGWIEPGKSVCDPNNYGGSINVIWAYFCETDDGQPFVAGAKVPMR